MPHWVFEFQNLGTIRLVVSRAIRRILRLAALAAGCAMGLAGADLPRSVDAAVLTNIAEILSLGNAGLLPGSRPALIRGVCTATERELRRVFLQDGESPIIVQESRPVDGLAAGDIVEVEGVAVSAFGRPQLLAKRTAVVGNANLPAPLRMEPEDLFAGAEIGRYVISRVVIRDVMWERGNLILMARRSSLFFRVQLPMPEPVELPASLIDARMEVSGACMPTADPWASMKTFTFLASSTNDLRVVDPGCARWSDRPLKTLAQVLDEPVDTINRARVKATVVGHISGIETLFVEDATGVARVNFLPLMAPGAGPTRMLEREPQHHLMAGEQIELIAGRFRGTEPRLCLYDGEFHRVGRVKPSEPAPVDGPVLRSEKFAHRLVSVAAKVVSHQVYNRGSRDEQIWFAESKGQLFQVRLEDGRADRPFPAGTLVEFVGIQDLPQWRVPNSGDIVLYARDTRDVEIIPPPPIWKREEVRKAAPGAAFVALLAAGGVYAGRSRARRIRASELRLRALIENSFDATIVLTAEGRVKYANPAGNALLGAVGPGASIASVVHPDDLGRILDAHREVLQRPGASRRVDAYRVVRGDGTVRVADAVGTNCLHVAGVEGVVVNIRDVTERVEADAAARRLEESTRVVHHFAASLLECDTEDDVVWDLARNCVARLGFVDCVVYLSNAERTVLVQRAALGPKSPDGRTIVNPIRIRWGAGVVGAAAAGALPQLVSDTRLDSRYIVDDQHRLSELAVPIVADGVVLGVIDSEHPEKGFFTLEHQRTVVAIASLCANKLVRVRALQEIRDLNARLARHVDERTAELRASEDRFSRVFRSSPTLLAIIRLPAGEHLDVNDAFLKTFGFGRDEVIGLNAFEIGLLPDADAASALAAELRASNAFRNRETAFCTRAGEVRAILLSAEFIEIEGGPCAVLVGQDVTERKRADEELLRSLEREKELNQLKSSFVSMVSHEFRTPLEVILSSHNILDRYLDRLSPEKREAQLRAIRKSVRRMSELLDDVLLLGRIEAGRMDFEPAPVRLDAVCRRLVDEAESAAECPGRIRCTFEDLVDDALADESLLQHILSNILGNALKYSPADSPVDFSVRRSGADAEFVIRDFGRGIPKEDQARLFTAFHRGANVGQTPGSGLGLVIVRRCVESHRGWLRLDTAAGAGSVFTVVLPVFPTRPPAGPGEVRAAWSQPESPRPQGS
jgi:PAS domain S-box-containing protein